MHSLCMFPLFCCSNLFDSLDRKEVDGIVYEVNCQMITVKAGADIDIGLYYLSLVFYCVKSLTQYLGANPSAEEQEDALEEGATQVNNVVHSFRLQSTSFDKKSYLTYLKARNILIYTSFDRANRWMNLQSYMKAVKEKLAESNPDQVQDFEKGAAAYAKKIIANFKDFEFVNIFITLVKCFVWYCARQYTGETMNPDGMVALLNYRVRFLSLSLSTCLTKTSNRRMV